jgi:hypothetical protein
MRSSIVLAVLFVSACAEETATSFASGAGGTGSSSGGTTGAVPTTGERPTTGELTTGTGSGGVVDPGTSGVEPGSTSTGAGAEATTDHGGDTSTGAGADTSTGEGGDTSTGAPAPGCADAVINQDETDVDCGGAMCAPCDLDGACLVDADCGSGWCDAQVCTQPGCLADADCDMFDEACVEASCDLAAKTCLIAAVNEGQACEDGDLCTTGEVCDKGGCLGGGAKDCSALDGVCGVGACDPQTGECGAQAIPEMEGAVCDDGFVCTPDDVCTAGLCGAGGPGFLFYEDFAAPDPGWELGPTWEVGPAVASPVGWNGADPDSDHSPGADDAIAGTVIGGLIPTGMIDKTCMTSPVLAAGDPGEPGALWLSFWRHLHTDHYPFAAHTVEAFDGQLWQTVEVGYANPGIGDAGWTFVTYDLTTFKHPLLRVRICHAQTESAFQAAGWSVDDVTVGPYACTPET